MRELDLETLMFFDEHQDALDLYGSRWVFKRFEHAMSGGPKIREERFRTTGSLKSGKGKSPIRKKQ